MKVKTFTYTKTGGDISQRVVLELVTPSTFMEGIDMSELDTEEQACFMVSANQLMDEYKAKMAALQIEYDLKHNYRRFDPLKMTEVNEEWV